MNTKLLHEHIADLARALGVTVKDRKLASEALQGIVGCCSEEGPDEDDEKPDLAIIIGAKKTKE